MTWENPTAIESRVGIAIETTEGTAESEPDLELFMNSGSAPELDLVVDGKIKQKAFNEPYKRGEIRGFWHTEGNLPGLKFSPTNGIPEFFKVGFGNDWYSKQLRVLTVATGAGTSFSRGDKIFGTTSKARGEITRVVSDTLWLTGVQGTFANSEVLIDGPNRGNSYLKSTAASAGFAAISGYYCHKMDGVRNFTSTGSHAILTTTKTGNKDLTFRAVDAGIGGEDISIECTVGGVDTPLSVTVTGNTIVIVSETDGSEIAVSTAAQILTLLNADASASALITTELAVGSTGAGIFGTTAHTHLVYAAPEIKTYTVSGAACLADTAIDFSEYAVTGKKRVFVTVKDEANIPISGWMGATCMYVAYDGGSAAFEVGSKLSAKTGGTTDVIGNVIAVVGNATSGYLFVEQDATARAILDNDTLTDNHGAHNGAAVANMPTIPAYLNNAVKIYDMPDSVGSTQEWNGDVTTFDETDGLSYVANQRTFDQKSMSVFVKDAGDATKVGKGTKIKELSFDITADSFAYNVGLLGRNVEYPTTEPAYPGGLTDSAPFGASTRIFEIDGLTTGQAAQVNKARFSATWDFAPNKGVVITENTPTTLQPTTYNIIGTLDVQWKSNAMMKAFWNNPSGNAPAAGDLISKRLSFLLDSGDIVQTGYNKMLALEVLGTIDSATLNRDQDGYIQPTTIEGYMHDDSHVWGPTRFYLYDSVATH